MLLIFDLDDTLIRTTESIAPLRLKKAFHKMGIAFEDEVISYNERAFSSESVLRHFCEKHKGSDKQLEIGLRELREAPLGLESSFKRDEAVIRGIEYLSQLHTLALVTKGVKAVQEEKIALFGIPKEAFQEIIILETGEKKSHYEQLAKKNNVLEKQVVVIGDRIEVDLKGAKELGFYTVHMKQGRGKYAKEGSSFVDYTIQQFEELLLILEKV